MIRVGILFGGISREREISFAGGRTVYDNLNKDIFEPVPVFIDSRGNFMLLDWQYIYKGTIRDFYPPASSYPESENQFQLYIESLGQLTQNQIDVIISKVGKRITPDAFRSLFDIAFLTLHGPYGEDGNIQGILEWYGIPYTGSGIYASALGVNKRIQKSVMQHAGFDVVPYKRLTRSDWKKFTADQKLECYEQYQAALGSVLVVKAPNQGSSIGVTVVQNKSFQTFERAVNAAFFIVTLAKSEWKTLDAAAKVKWVSELADIRSGIGLPVVAHALNAKAPGGVTLYRPSQLLQFIDDQFQIGITDIQLESIHGEFDILIEQFVEGQEFSCIVIQNESGAPIALPPTQIIKSNAVFDYRSKYLPGITKKITPIDLPTPHIERIRENCEQLFTTLQCNVYARIDGFFANDGRIFLNDPNTTSGMLPSSFFFHQAAEIGLNPSQFITYIIRTSLAERLREGKNIHHIETILHQLDDKLHHLNQQQHQKKRVAVIMGGYSTERHISVESGRNVYEKLASSTKYVPTPIFLTGSDQAYTLYQIPINVMLKDNADDIKDKILATSTQTHDVIQHIIDKTAKIRSFLGGSSLLKPQQLSLKDLKNQFDEVFIALHGRPGEDGSLQKHLDALQLPYNGSGVATSAITIDKYETNERLGALGIPVAKHRLVSVADFSHTEHFITEIEQAFRYPFIAKPHDDGCSSAVKKIKNRAELVAFGEMMFRQHEAFIETAAKILQLKHNEEFPRKQFFLIEQLIDANGAMHFLEITGGMLTRRQSDGNLEYEVFEPSETLASGEVLSLEEKFLAGEGQNITPARFSKNPDEQKRISAKVRDTLEKVARILNVEGYCRIDAFVRIFQDGSVETIIIEINSLPGMTPATCIYHQAAINGYKPFDFIDKILEYGRQRTKN